MEPGGEPAHRLALRVDPVGHERSRCRVAALTEAAGVPVLTATQVTLWSLFRALGRTPAAAAAGPLFGGDELR
jgi:maleate cis-trans isomerase